MATTIQHIKFHTPITAEWAPGGTEDWSVTTHQGPDARHIVDAIDKGNSIHLVWVSKSSGKHAGKTCRIRVPLTNIASVFEIDDETPTKEKSK